MAFDTYKERPLAVNRRGALLTLRCASDAYYFVHFVLFSSLLARLPFCRGLGRVLADAELDDPLDQFVGNRLIKRKLQVAFWTGIAPNRSLQDLVTGNRRVEADVFFPGGEIDEDAVLPERGHLVADDFRGAGAARRIVARTFLRTARTLAGNCLM